MSRATYCVQKRTALSMKLGVYLICWLTGTSMIIFSSTSSTDWPPWACDDWLTYCELTSYSIVVFWRYSCRMMLRISCFWSMSSSSFSVCMPIWRSTWPSAKFSFWLRTRVPWLLSAVIPPGVEKVLMNRLLMSAEIESSMEYTTVWSTATFLTLDPSVVKWTLTSIWSVLPSLFSSKLRIWNWGDKAAEFWNCDEPLTRSFNAFVDPNVYTPLSEYKNTTISFVCLTIGCSKKMFVLAQ